MIPGINPAMITYMIKGKLDEILSGTYPEDLFLKEKTDTVIILGLQDPEKYEGIKLNGVKASITYKEIEIIIEHYGS